MIEYIYFVKCPNCEDEPFDFFDEAKAYALGCLSNKPIITQVEVNRNDFGECTDSCDLGTQWSWEDECQPDVEPACSTFTKKDLGTYMPDHDPEFTDIDNSVDFEPETSEVSAIDEVPDNFRRPIAEDFDRVKAAAKCSRNCYDFYKAIASKAPQKEINKYGKAAYKYVKDQYGLVDDAAEDLLWSGYVVWRQLHWNGKTESLVTENTSLETTFIRNATKAPKDSDYVIALRHSTGGKRHTFLGTDYKMTADLSQAMTYSSKFAAEDDTKYVVDEVLKMPGASEKTYYADRIFVTTVAEAKRLRGRDEPLAQYRNRIAKPITEAKTDSFHDAIFEAIDYLTEFSDFFPVPENIGSTSWEELKDDIRYGLSSDFEIAEIILQYLDKDLEFSRKHPEMFEDDPQSELTLETYNRLKRAFDRAVAAYEAEYPEDFEESLTEDIKADIQKFISFIPKNTKPAHPVAKNGKCGGCQAQLPAPNADGISICQYCGGMYAGETYICCPMCGGSIDVKNDFKCKSCGTTLTALVSGACSNCGGAIDKTNKCINCGTVVKKPIPEGMTIEQLVETMEENEDVVECKSCGELCRKSQSTKDEKLGWICELCSFSTDPGDAVNKVTESKSFDPKQEIEFDYDGLSATAVDSDWNENTYTRDYTYKVSAEDVATAIWEMFLTYEDVADVSGGFDTLEDDKAWKKFLDTHFEALLEKYYEQLSDYFQDMAQDEFSLYVSSEDFEINNAADYWDNHDGR